MNEQGYLAPAFRPPADTKVWCPAGKHWFDRAGDDRKWSGRFSPDCNLARNREQYTNNQEYRARRREQGNRVHRERMKDPEFRERERQRARDKHKRPEVRERSRWRYILRKYGVTQEQWEQIYDAQGGRCALCSRAIPREPGNQCNLDHDHESGEVRGLLCRTCNIWTGGQDSPGWMSRAQGYKDNPPARKVLARRSSNGIHYQESPGGLPLR